MPRKRGAGAVPKQTVEAFFPRTPEQVCRAVTDPIYWDWPNGPGTVHEPRDGPIIVTEDWGLTEEMLTVFRVAAFAPPRWYAVELDNRETAGRCEVYFFRERRGTRVEFTADLYGKMARQKLLLRFRLGRWQQQYVEHLRKVLRIK